MIEACAMVRYATPISDERLSAALAGLATLTADEIPGLLLMLDGSWVVNEWRRCREECACLRRRLAAEQCDE